MDVIFFFLPWFIFVWLLGYYDNAFATNVNQRYDRYVKHSVKILEIVAAFNTYAVHVHLHFCAKWKGHYSSMLWIHLVVFACLYDPFVYSGMATGTEGAGCFVFAPFNMQPWRSYYCAVVITFEWKATSSGREKKKEPQAGLIFFSDLKPYTEWPSPLSDWICGWWFSILNK